MLAQTPDPLLLTNNAQLADPLEYSKMVLDPEYVSFARDKATTLPGLRRCSL
jgi:hypothetical protein